MLFYLLMESIREFIETETITKLLCIIVSNLKKIVLTKKERFVNKWLTEEWKNNILFYRYTFFTIIFIVIYMYLFMYKICWKMFTKFSCMCVCVFSSTGCSCIQRIFVGKANQWGESNIPNTDLLTKT